MASARYLQLLRDAADLHVRKSAGYVGSDNPDVWANFREAERWGLTPLQGCLVRMGDKFVRAQNLTRDPANDQVGESLRETLVDLLAYAGISVCLLDEQSLGREEPGTFVVGSPDYELHLRALRSARAEADIFLPETLTRLLAEVDAMLGGVAEEASGLPIVHCHACGADFTGSYGVHQRSPRHRVGTSENTLLRWRAASPGDAGWHVEGSTGAGHENICGSWPIHYHDDAGGVVFASHPGAS